MYVCITGVKCQPGIYSKHGELIRPCIGWGDLQTPIYTIPILFFSVSLFTLYIVRSTNTSFIVCTGCLFHNIFSLSGVIRFCFGRFIPLRMNEYLSAFWFRFLYYYSLSNNYSVYRVNHCRNAGSSWNLVVHGAVP